MSRWRSCARCSVGPLSAQSTRNLNHRGDIMMEETLAIGLAVRLLMEETLTNGAGSVTVNDGGDSN